MLLDACTAFCASLHATFGETAVNYAAMAGGLLLVWWNGRKQAAKVAANTKAEIAVVAESASKAKAEAREAQKQLARIEGSLRPAAIPPSSPPSVEVGSSSSGTFQPVLMPDLPPGVSKPRPSMPEPDLLEPTIPRPSAVPSLDRETPLERPKGGK